MSWKCYNVTETALKCENYEVKINGEKVKLNTARTSKEPFNRRWPGHQRDILQSELVNFLSLEINEELHFEIKPSVPFEQVVVRPVSLNITPEISADGIIRFCLKQPAYFTVEPYGRQNALHVFADPLSDYNISKEDENVLYFGSGEHDVGMIHLKSNQTLFIDEGAVVYACVRAKDAENIKIFGRGILDNSRNKEEILFEANEQKNESMVKNAVRKHTIQIEYCNNVKIEGITIRDSLVYNIRPMGCENLDIRNVKIIGCWRYNSDGIDMHNCVNVYIDNCFIRTFDDCICIKGFDFYQKEDVEKATREAMYRNGKCYDIFKNVQVKNCVLWNDWGKCLEIGAETKAEEICDITFEDCHIIHVTGPVLDCMNVDYADVHDVLYKNIMVEYDDIVPHPQIQEKDEEIYQNQNLDYAPSVICVEVCYHFEYSVGVARRGKNRKIIFDNIFMYGRHTPKLVFRGHSDENGISDICVKNFYLNGKLITKQDCTIVRNEFCKNIKIFN